MGQTCGTGTGLRAGPSARVTGILRHHLHAHGHAGGGVGERDRHLALDVAAATRAASGPTPGRLLAAEEATEEVAEATLAGVAEQVLEVDARALSGPSGLAAAGEPEAAAEHAPRVVVLLALHRVRQHGVRLGDLLESTLRILVVGVLVGVVLPRQLAEGLLDLLRLGVLGDAEDLVVILLEPVLRAHQRLLSFVSRSVNRDRRVRSRRPSQPVPRWGRSPKHALAG